MRRTGSEGRSALQARADALRNRAAIEAAATRALHENGLRIPMTQLAADAGVGTGTLYRHFPTRHALLAHLTERSFAWLLHEARSAADADGTGSAVIGGFLRRVLEHRGSLVLPLHGGPAVEGGHAQELNGQLRNALQDLIRRGIEDGSIARPVDPWDLAVMGAALTQPHMQYPDWDDIGRRLIATYVAGLSQTPPS